MIGRAVLAIPLLIGTSCAQAGWDIGGGLEHYRWVEYPENTSGTPKETGPRYVLFVNWTQEAEQGVLFAWRAKLYAGTVDYDTFLISTGAPVSTKTDYGGVASEALLFYRTVLGYYRLDYLGGFGEDFWRRSIRNIGFDQIEDYSILYLRVGVRLAGHEAGFHGECGVKSPFSTREDAHLDRIGYTSNPLISPKGQLSGYAEFGYRIDARFDVVGYYDSWRFDRSDDVVANDTAGNTWRIHQPRSHMDALGIKLLVSF